MVGSSNAGCSSTPRRASRRRSAPWTNSCSSTVTQEVKAFKKLCRTAFACAADAQQALATFAQDLQATFLVPSTVRPTPRYDKRGRPGQGTQPDQVVYQIDGGLASSRAARQARLDQHSCFILATNALDGTHLLAARAVGRL